MRGAGIILAAGVAGLAAPAAAHPHIFIDTGVEFLFDDAGKLAALRVVWAYDELYSLLILEDMGLDDDYDGVLTEAERAALSGFDMAWVEGYDGDLRGTAGGQDLALSGPLDWTADVRDGRIITTHVRALETRVDPRAAPVVLRPYDPTFYTAYSATLANTASAAGCTAETVPFDEDAAYAGLEQALAEAEAGGMDVEMDYPAVGALFADEIRLTCGPTG